LLVFVSYVDHLRGLLLQNIEDDRIGILRFVKKNEVGCNCRLGERPQLQITIVPEGYHIPLILHTVPHMSRGMQGEFRHRLHRRLGRR
jgi:hypothetical protein